MELTYTKQGDYLIPNLGLPESPNIGKYGMLRRTYLRNHHKGLHTGMMLSQTLNRHLEEIDREANEMLETLTRQMAKEQGVTESLKASNQMEWVRQMNSIHNIAEKIILEEFVYS